MHPSPELPVCPERKQESRRWIYQNQFLQDRHGPSKATSSERIVVGLPFDDDGFDILSWTISMASRPGDSVVALRLRPHDSIQTLKGGGTHDWEVIPEVSDARFKPLQELCNVKQVQLNVKLAVYDAAEKLLVDEVSSIRATMLVVSTSGHHVMRHAQKRGIWLARHVPIGCSVVVVKSYKVLFYKENSFRASAQKNCILHEEGTPHNLRQVSQGPDEQSESFGNQLSNITVRETKSHCEVDKMNLLCNKVWLEHPEPYSPKRVLDGPCISSESDESPTSIVEDGLFHSSSRRALVSCTSYFEDDDIFCIRQPRSFLNIWRGGTLRHSQSCFSAASFKKLSTPFHFRSMGSSLKSYVNNLCCTRTVKRGGMCTPSISSETKISLNCFNYEEISTATNGFHPENMVGKGGHAEVYKGVLADGLLVAVKRAIKGDTEEEKVRDFLTELGIICHVSHPNVTPLIGFCIEGGLHLIFPFSQQGTLASLLHGATLQPLQWAMRYKVALGTARGLNYLHTSCQHRIIHRDIKASNILLGPDFEPQISDFGLAKWLPDKCWQHILSPIEGTFGYLAPEYVMHGIVDEKTDVYAFGVLLLELITGRMPIESSQPSLVIWAWPFLESLNSVELADTRLEGAYDLQELQCMMMTAALCLQHSPLCRPSMSQVLQLLTDEVDSDTADSWGMGSSQSFFLQDSIFDENYSSVKYRNDLRRHQEIALQF